VAGIPYALDSIGIKQTTRTVDKAQRTTAGDLSTCPPGRLEPHLHWGHVTPHAPRHGGILWKAALVDMLRKGVVHGVRLQTLSQIRCGACVNPRSA
jgi:hypothetical protein